MGQVVSGGTFCKLTILRMNMSLPGPSEAGGAATPAGGRKRATYVERRGGGAAGVKSWGPPGGQRAAAPVCVGDAHGAVLVNGGFCEVEWVARAVATAAKSAGADSGVALD